MDFLSIADDQSLKTLAGYNVRKGGMARSHFAKYKDWTLPILDEVTCLCQGIIVTNGRIHYLQSQVTVEHVAKGVFTGNSEQWLPLLAVGNLALNCWPTGHRYITVYQQSAGSVNFPAKTLRVGDDEGEARVICLEDYTEIA